LLASRLFGEVGIAYGYSASLTVSSLIAASYYLFGNWRKARIYGGEA